MANMKIIQPVAITVDMFSYCNVTQPAAGETLWDPTLPYAVGDTAIRTQTHTVYKRLIAGTTAAAPETDTTNWQVYSSTQQWAMLDRKIGSQTSIAGDLVVVLTPGQVSAIAILEAVGRSARVVMRDHPGGTVVYDTTVNLNVSQVDSVYSFLFGEYEQKTDFVLTDLPSRFNGCELTITISSTTTAAIGVLQVGQVFEVGYTQYDPTVSIDDFTVKAPDGFGYVDVQERSFSKQNTMNIEIPKANFNKIYRLLASIRATPCVYIGVDDEGFEPMLVYGFYKSFSITIPYFDTYLCALEIEGLNT